MAKLTATSPFADGAGSEVLVAARALRSASDRYEVRRRLGEGGMGVVHEAYDRERGQSVALKRLINFTPATLYRLKQEFRTLADVHHPNLVRLHELVVGEGQEAFFTMEMVRGTDFLTHVKPVRSVAPVAEQTPVDLELLRRASRQLVEGVMALHEAGKLHRDLKPSNVMVAEDGRVVILDFGVSTELRRVDRNLSEQEEMVGSVHYMAPEQALAEATTPASDWYSVGAVLYEALAGRTPFVGSAFEVLTMKTTHDPMPLAEVVSGVPPELDALCRALLDRDPAKRPHGAAILRALRGAQSYRPLPSLQPAGGAERAPALVGREAQLAGLRGAFEAVRAGGQVTVRIAGASGMGKSAVAAHFVDGLVEQGEAVVLRGRAYERESVPFKAVDGVIDALSRFLMHLEDEGDRVALPADIPALARVFPVLRRVPSIGELASEEVTDHNLVRRRAFEALRALLATLARRQPLVVFVDDAQWGDVDSAALLLELVRPPDAPPLLLVLTQRTEEAEASPFLTEMRQRWPEGAEAREVPVGPLSTEDGQRFAAALLGAADEATGRVARAAARESKGSPFLIEELVRGHASNAARTDGQTLSALTLREMVAQRLERLPAEARVLVEVVAVGGRPMPVSLVARASGSGEAVEQVVAAARARRFVRTGLRDGREIVEMSHDRFRETVVEQLSPEALRGHHLRLAGALEATPGADAEALSVHLRGAGDPARAAIHAERAAEEAIAKLAFDQAARLLRTVLETTPADPETTRRLQKRLGTVLQWSGRAEHAARAYLAAAKEAPALERLDLERAAAAELIAAGNIDEGVAAFRRVLAGVGRAVPPSPLGILFGVVLYRVLSLFLLRARLRDDALDPEVQVRLDAMQAVARALALVDPLSAMHVKARYLVDALRSGSRFHVLRAATGEASTLASSGGRVGARERALFATARRLAVKADEDGTDAEGMGLYEVAYGISEYLRGRWRSSLDLLESAYVRLSALRRWPANPSVYRIYTLTSLGDLPAVRRQTERLLADAVQRGDKYTAVNLEGSHPTAAWLAADDVPSARRRLQRASADWSRAGFLVQHWQFMLWETEVELYSGAGAKAWQRLAVDATSLRRSHLLRVQLVRAMTLFIRGRSAVASLADLPEPERGPRLAEARRAHLRLRREKMPWTEALAAMLEGSIALRAGDAVAAESALRRAMALAEAVEMPLHAAAARRALGLLSGGEAGALLVKEAEAALAARGVQAPGRYARMLVPGAATPA